MEIKKALKILGLGKWEDISSNTLRSLYKDLAKKTHPDVAGGDKEKFVEVQKAFDTISRKMKKRDKEISKKDSSKDKKSKKTSKQKDVKVDNKTRDLKELDKEDLMDKILEAERQITVYKEFISDHKTAVGDAKKEVKLALEKFEEVKDELRKELEEAVEKLEKKYEGTLLNKMLFFLPRMKESEFTEKYNRYVDKYSSVAEKLDGNFFKNIIDIYGVALNKIQKEPEETEED